MCEVWVMWVLLSMEHVCYVTLGVSWKLLILNKEIILLISSTYKTLLIKSDEEKTRPPHH